jgi:NADH dehydrogenase
MFIPFYMAGRDRLRVVIIGGGYAGLSAMEVLRRHRPDAEIVLIDPREAHLKIAHLHESFRRPLKDFELSFRSLEKRFGIQHIQDHVDFDKNCLSKWNEQRKLTVAERNIDCDFMIIATGAQSKVSEKGVDTLDLGDFVSSAGSELLERRLANAGDTRWLTVVGSGPTGVQFLFEIAHFLRRRERSHRLRLIDAGPEPLQEFNPKIGRYVAAKLDELGIDYLPRHRFVSQDGDLAIVENQETCRVTELPSDFSLVFSGKERLSRFGANRFGQVVANEQPLDRVFVAGDCSHYRGMGSNAMSAQSAVRKGRLVARNILRAAGPFKIMEPYLHRDLGYIVSMGPSDSVGWLGCERNVVAGLPAGLAKEVVETQYDLLLSGIDTYLL